MNIEAFAHSEMGSGREVNEDSYVVDPKKGLFVVADGMGGKVAGDVASRLAVDTVKHVLFNQQDPDETRLIRDITDEEESIRERMRYAMSQACNKLRQEIIQSPEHRGLGTTLTIVLIEDGIAHFSHVGDSRLYLYSNDVIRRLTRDHTAVQNEIDAGRLTPELAKKVPHKDILTQFIGAQSTVDPVTSTRPVSEDDILILCTDGITDVLDDAVIEQLIQNNNFEDLAFTLVDAALAAGSQDNSTVIVIKILE